MSAALAFDPEEAIRQARIEANRCPAERAVLAVHPGARCFNDPEAQLNEVETWEGVWLGWGRGRRLAWEDAAKRLGLEVTA